MQDHIGQPGLDAPRAVDLIARVLQFIASPEQVRWTWLVDEDPYAWGSATITHGKRSAELYFSREFDGALLQQFMSADTNDDGTAGTHYIYTSEGLKTLRQWLFETRAE